MSEFQKVRLYEIREWVGFSESKRLGRKLRSWKRARRILKWLQARGRESYAASMVINRRRVKA